MASAQEEAATLRDAGHGPLSGLLVLDFGMAAVGPVAASYMAMLGATVIKIEQPSGDLVRYGTPTMRGMSTTFIGNNVGKFGVVLDLKSDSDRAEALALASAADVMIDNFRSPDVLVRLGLGYFDVLRPRNPRLIYLQASAFGPVGPWKGMVSFEWMSQACSGFVGATGENSGLPEFSRGTAYLDWNGGMMNLVAMLAGLHYREKTGEGIMLSTSQFGSSVHTSLTRLVEAAGSTPRHGSAGTGVVPDRVFRTSDSYLSVSTPSDSSWSRLCKAIGRDDLLQDQALSTVRGRVAERDRLESALIDTFRGDATATWLDRLRQARVATAEHRWDTTIGTLLENDRQISANHMVARQESWYGSVLTQTPHWTFRETRASLRRPSPLLGEHNDLVRSLLGHLSANSESPMSAPPDGPDAASPLGMTLLADDRVLTGLRVIEVGTGLSPAVGGMVLQRLGAEIAKIEPPHGDWLRSWGGSEGDSSLWNAVNAGKNTLVCDLKSAVGLATLQKLIGESDVALISAPVETRVRLGCDEDSLRALNPHLIYCGVTGWGVDGPLANQPATELDVQIATGMTLQLGRNGQEPIRQGFDLVSMNAGVAAAQAILAMLYARSVGSSDGDAAEVSLLHTAIAISQWNTAAESDPDAPIGRQLEAYNWEPDHGYRGRDGRVFISLRNDDEAWTKLFLTLDRVDLLGDERFSTLEAVRKNERFLPALLEPDLIKYSYEELEEIVRGKLGGNIVPILEPHEVAKHPQTRALRILSTNADGGLGITLPILHIRPSENADETI